MYSLLKKLLFAFEPETAHALVKKIAPLIPSGLIENYARICNPSLQSAHFGISFDNPVGLAAGFDKNGELIELMTSLGFGYVEIGSVTFKKWEGNPLPRIFRLPKDASLINRMGLPNCGAEAINERLARKKWKIPVGINIAKTPGSDEGSDVFVHIMKKMAPQASYFVLNLSCPNTPDGATFEDPLSFLALAEAVADQKKIQKNFPPILIKLSPDSDDKDLEKLVGMACEKGFDGFVLGNTTSDRRGLTTPEKNCQK